jgi:PAS domain S-box-containing protein
MENLREYVMENDFFELKVLYVEDSDIIRKTGSEIIKSKVRELIVAKDGAEGLQMYKDHNPDLVITDIGMPEMDGLTMSKHIMHLNPDAVIIITTAFDDNKFIKEAISIGVNEYILKSSIRSQLVMTINKWYDKIIESKRKKANFDFINLISKKIIEYAPLIIMVSNGNNVIEFVNKYFCEQTGYSEVEIIGQSPNILKSGSHTKEYYLEMWDLLNSGNNWEGLLKNKRKDGSIYTEKAVIIPISQDDAQANYYLKFSQVITDDLPNKINDSKKIIALFENIDNIDLIEEKIKNILPNTNLTFFKNNTTEKN